MKQYPESAIARTRRRSFRVRSLALLIAAVLLAAPATALAADAGITLTSTYTDAQVRALWTQLKPSHAGSPYLVAPSTEAPYATGSLNASFVADGLNTLNFGRFLAGVPHDVVLDPAKASEAQYGAVLLAAVSPISHTPSKPADMAQSFYDTGYASTTTSNIGSGYATSAQFQLGCLRDDEPDNLPVLGHRRWLLNPRMAKTGIGYAVLRNTTYAFDTSRAAVDYTAIAYPSAGPFPVDGGFLDPTTPWSITLNPARYDWADTGHTVTLKRVADGKTWIFTAADTDTSGEYFNLDIQGYGVANCFVFRPDPTTIAYEAGDQFDVTLSGGIYADGTKTPVTVSYRTRLISLSEPTPNMPPVGVDDTYAANAGTTLSMAAPGVLDNDSDADPGSTRAAELLSAPANGTVDLEAGGSFSYTPNEGFAGADSFTYRVYDGLAYSGPVRVNITVTKVESMLWLSGPQSAPDYDGSGTLTARLIGTDGSMVSGRTVIFERLDGANWVAVGAQTTGPTGYAMTWVSGLRARQTYRARFAGCATYDASAAEEVPVLPRAKLNRTTSWAALTLKRAYVATGYIAPKHDTDDANRVNIRAYKKGADGDYHYVKSFTASYADYSAEQTTYKATITFKKASSKGMWKLVAYHAGDAKNAKTYGVADYVRVK